MTSVTGVLGQSIHADFKRKLDSIERCNYSQGLLFFVSSLSVEG